MNILESKESQYGPCGIYCGACGTTDCYGCHSDKVDEYVLNCFFRKCAKEKHVEFCCDCEDYPCTYLYEFMTDEWPHHWTIKSSLQFIKKHGKEKWLKDQKIEWSCLNCHARTAWYQKQCECGQNLKAWDLPEGYKT